MKIMTIKNRPMTERILERREQYFSGIEEMTDEQIERVSVKWHAIANRYQKMVATILIRRNEVN
jgi:hypothetical protein